ncbi:hypothetical protein V4D30_01685 [Thermodesulfovibrio sp. 3907-1M]|uniref:DUF1640 domain-containing protein n=1 Tax=Thermodesulfovibrio autotrophicus TaxID=3118333 RepID=A0AAU8GZI9_9BACT
MPVTEIEVYETLKEHVGEKSAKTLLEFINVMVEKEFERKKDILATKQDIAELRSATKQDIAELEVKIERVRADLIKWMFIFWAGQIGALTAILALFFK